MKVVFDGKSESTQNAKNLNGKKCVRKEKFPHLMIVFNENEKVNDETRGILTFETNHWFFISASQYYNLKSKKGLKRLGLLLESPHKSEYQNGLPIRPANGVTGEKIEALLANKMSESKLQKELPKTYDYEVVLINAIQYQTSCYKLLKEEWNAVNRDHVFRLMYNNFGLKADLMKRLQSYGLDYLINCVTNNLKKEVQEDISKYFKATILEYSHPSSWK